MIYGDSFMSNSLISVIIPAYNIESYIEKTVDSVLSQTYENIEIIIVNDGSTDNTAEVIDALAKKDLRIRVMHKENGGVTSARLAGVAAAKGEYIGFVDGDDTIESDMYEFLMNNALKYQADISHCGYQMVFPSRVDKYYGTGEIIEQNNKKGVLDLLSGIKIEPSLVNKLYKAGLFDVLLQEQNMDLSIKNTEDLLMNYYLFKESKKSVFEDVCKYNYVVRQGSAANKRINIHQLLDPLKVKKIILEDTNDTDCKGVLNAHIANILISLSTRSLKEDPQLIKPIRKDARGELRSMLPQIEGKSQKIKAVWAAYLPTSYRWVHNIYLKITGLDRIYEIS